MACCSFFIKFPYVGMVFNSPYFGKYVKINSKIYFLEKNLSIDDYRPTFVVEAVYDLRADDLLRRGIHAVLVDLDNTLIAWNNPDYGGYFSCCRIK